MAERKKTPVYPKQEHGEETKVVKRPTKKKAAEKEPEKDPVFESFDIPFGRRLTHEEKVKLLGGKI